MKRVILTTMMLLGVCLAGRTQAIISQESMTSNGKSVAVSFVVDTEESTISSNRKEVISPYIFNETDTLWLDQVMVYGKNRYRRERQENHIKGDKNWELGHNQIMKHDDKFTYTDEAPLKLWMTSAKLGIKREIVGCAQCNESGQDEILTTEELFQMPELPARRTPEYMLADAERLWDFGQDELEIIFKVSKIDIDHSVFNNKVTFAKILEAVDKIYSNPKYKLDKIQVAGYASPEGTPQFNRWLGENRAKVLIEYIISKRPEYNLKMSDFEIVNGQENWAGLRRMVLASNIDRKDDVIAIIDNPRLSNEGKKQQIKSLDYYNTWMQMLDQIYPHLRCARYLAVYYDSTDDLAVEIINQGNQMIREGRYQEALDHLKSVEEDIRAYNSIGVALMMQLKFEEAMPWFEKALENNSPSALANIDAINAEYDYEQQQCEAMEEYLKQFE